MSENSCLSADQLKSYALGRLDDRQTELVSQHLQDCQNCEETLSGFDDTNDSLLLQIRTARPPAEDSPAPLEAALAGIAALHSDGPGTSTQPSETLNNGTQPQAADDWVRDYRLVGKLGQGGMGTVYKAVHERLQRTVALKLLPARRLRNREAVGRFEREMQAIGRLDHPAIVRATDAGEVEGTHFLAMDYVNGIDLSKVVRLTGPLSVPNACEVIRVVATGLSYAHEQGLIHRDVKPSNIMLALPDGGGQASVKLLDLGLALFGAASEAVDDFTTVGQLMGTLDYMAPEQADHSHVNATADVYSMGATLFKLLTGKAPFETREFQSPLQKMKALATMSVPSLQDRRPETPPSLVAIADQLLQRDPADRMSSAAEVSHAMQPFCEGHNLKQLAEQAIQEQALEDAKIETEILPSAQPSLPSALLKSPQLENGVKPAVASGAGTNNNNNRWKRWLAGFAAVPLFAFLGAIIWIQTDRGTLKIESVADDVPIEIRQGKQLVESFTLKSGTKEISLRSGRHEVKIAADYDQLQMSSNKVEIQRGGEAIVRVEHVTEGVGSLFRSSGPSQGKSAPPKKTPDPLGSVAIFEGKTYAEWKSILNRERSPAELIKGIDALAALSDDSNAAETCEAILKIMDPFQAVPREYSIESKVLKTGARRIRELDPETVEPVLRDALGTISANVDTLILGELCNYTTLLYGENPLPNSSGFSSRPNGPSGPIEPLRTMLLRSENFVEAAFRSWPNWGSGNVRTPFSRDASFVLYHMIWIRRQAQKPLTPAMLDFCKQVVEQGMNPDNGVDPSLWQPAMIVLLETTDQEDLPDLLWKQLTSQEVEIRSSAWRRLAESMTHYIGEPKPKPIAIRKMLSLLKAGLAEGSRIVLTSKPGSNFSNGGFGFGPQLDQSQQPLFYRSTLIVELMGLAGKDAISCRQLLSDQFMLHTGAVPKSDGVHTYQAAEDQICTRLNNLQPAEGDTEDAEAKATLRHVQALLWAWEQITGEPARFAESEFPEPQFPKLAEFPKELQPKIAKYNGKTIAEWAEFDGSDFESWEAETQRYRYLSDLSIGDADEPLFDKRLLDEAKEPLTEFCLADYRDDEHWFELVASIASDSVNAVGLTQLLQKVSPEERAKIFCRSLALSFPFKAKQVEEESPASSLIVFLTVPMDPDSEPSFSPVLNEIVRSVPELSVALQIDVLKRLVAYHGQLSSEALKTVQQLSTEDSEIGFLANLVATRQWSGNDPTRDVFIDRLLQQLEQPGKDDARWVNAALSLGVAVRKGATLDQLQRLVKIVEDTTASKSVDVLWRYTDGPPNAIAVSRRVLALQILSELAKTESGVRAPSTDPAQATISMVTPVAQFEWESVRELAGPAGAPQQAVSLMPDADDANQVYYVQSVRPSTDTDELVASEWAARVLEGVGMLKR